MKEGEFSHFHIRTGLGGSHVETPSTVQVSQLSTLTTTKFEEGICSVTFRFAESRCLDSSSTYANFRLPKQKQKFTGVVVLFMILLEASGELFVPLKVEEIRVLQHKPSHRQTKMSLFLCN